MKSIAVFCGANKGSNPLFEATAKAVGRELARRGIQIVFGAGKVGLMGVLADACLQHGGEVVGVIPSFLKEKEVCHMGLSRLIEVETMHERKQIMAEMAEGIIVLPGGYGTLDEFFEILTWRQLHLHSKPIGLLNVLGYYDFLLQHVDQMTKSGFMQASNRDLFIVENELQALLEKMEEDKTEAEEKWLDRS